MGERWQGPRDGGGYLFTFHATRGILRNKANQYPFIRNNSVKNT